jgi:hypothetical protein
MPLQFAPSTPDDAPAIALFLQTVFGLPPDAGLTELALLAWKYYTPRPDWPGPRSYLLKRDREIAAHGCLWPLTFETPSGPVTCNHLIDWAAHPRIPGAGLLLLRHLARVTDALLTIGGSDATRQILPRAGYRPFGSLTWYARVVRPWRQFLTHPASNTWKAPARLVRNILWSRSPLHSSGGWSTGPIDHSLAPLLARRAFPAPARTLETFPYFQHCPAARITAHLLKENGLTRGYFLLAAIGHQTRIADLWITSETASDWQSALAAATRAAAALPATAEIISAASTEVAAAAHAANGYRQRGAIPVFLYDPKSLLPPAGSPELTLIDGDAAWWQDPAHPYLT